MSAPHTRPLTLDDLLDIRSLALLRSVALSPDGHWVAFAAQRSGDRRQRRDIPPHGVPSIWEATRLVALPTDAPCPGGVALAPRMFAAWSPSWSPHGRRLAFLAAERAEGPVELWAWDVGEPAARPVTSRPVQAHGMPRWFPDGRRMCVPLVPAVPLRPTVPLAPLAPAGTGEPPQPAGPGIAVFESPAPPRGPQELGPAQQPLFRAHLAAVDTDTGDVHPLVTGDRTALEGYPSPDGRHLLWSAAPVRADARRSDLQCALHLLTMPGPGRPAAPQPPVATLTVGANWPHWQPRWSPDGRRFCAVVGGDVTVWTVDHPREPLCRLPLPAGHAANGWLAWTPGGAGIVACAADRLWLFPDVDTAAPAVALRAGERAITGLIHRLDSDAVPPGDLGVLTRHEILRIRAGTAEAPATTMAAYPARLWGFRTADAMYALGDATPDGRRFVYAVGDQPERADLWVAGPDGHRPLTDLNPHLRGIATGAWHRFDFRTAHGVDAAAAVLTPPDWQPGHPCPTVVCFYPGTYPSGQPELGLAGVPAPLEPALLAAQGYAVLLPDVPYAPHAAADPIATAPAAVLPAVNEAVRLGYADPRRLAVMGTSFGATAVLGLLARTGRFRVAVAEAGAADMTAMYGQMHRALDHPDALDGAVAWCETGQGGMGAPPWERPLRYVANSPVYLLDRITTPLLLIAGSQDAAVSWAQSGEVFAGLRRLGRPCTLLVGRGEGHGLSAWSEPNRREAVTRILAWIARHLQAE